MIARIPRLASLLACSLALLFGCAKEMASPTSDPAYSYDGGSGGDDGSYGGYAYDEDVMPTAAAEMVVVAKESAPARGRWGRSAKKDSADYRADKNSESIPEGAPPPEPIAVTTDTSKPAEPVDQQTEPTDDDHDERQIIYTASLSLAVFELERTMAFAEDIPRRHGGWIQARYDWQITLRVPADHLQIVIAELSELGQVLCKTLQADDVTAQYTDLESRIAVLEQLVEQLELLLKQAKTVEESLEVRQELERVRIELESAKAQMRQLAESISFSTLTLSLSPRGPVEDLPSSNDPFPWVDELGVESTEYR